MSSPFEVINISEDFSNVDLNNLIQQSNEECLKYIRVRNELFDQLTIDNIGMNVIDIKKILREKDRATCHLDVIFIITNFVLLHNNENNKKYLMVKGLSDYLQVTENNKGISETTHAFKENDYDFKVIDEKFAYIWDEHEYEPDIYKRRWYIMNVKLYDQLPEIFKN